MKAVLIFASMEWKKGQRSPFAHIIEKTVKRNLCLDITNDGSDQTAIDHLL